MPLVNHLLTLSAAREGNLFVYVPHISLCTVWYNLRDFISTVCLSLITICWGCVLLQQQTLANR